MLPRSCISCSFRRYDDYNDFGKVGIGKYGAKADVASQQLQAVYTRDADDGLSIITHATFPDRFVENAGAPQAVWLEWTLPKAAARGGERQLLLRVLTYN
jgi:hypothetical protein